ncbi:MAG: carbon-nitrogen hydrolase family protein [Ruminococcaceae bacterium]|nr:carbon-nitrogen hydrolase family protein [Oscillospiraceae bacterium]
MFHPDKFEERIYSDASAPQFNTEGDCYSIKANGSYSIGAFISSSPLSELEGEYLSASVGIESEGKGTQAMAILLFFDAEGRKLQSDFLSDRGGIYTACVKVPSGAVKVSLELICYCFEGGAVFSAPTLTEAEPPKDRSFTVATAYFKREGSTEANMRAILSLIDRAGKDEEKPTLICFTEAAYDLGLSHCYIPESHPDVQKVREAAKRNSIYVLFTFHEDDKYHYNTAILIDPNGETVGKYRKVQPTLGELRMGIAPGTELPVFELPFAKVGVIICWDQYFYETSRTLVRKGAEVILWPSRGYHEERMLTRARDNGVYLVSSHPLPERCCIAGPAEWKILARGEGEEGYASYRIDLNDRLVSEYKSFGKNGGNDNEIYLNELRRDFYI